MNEEVARALLELAGSETWPAVVAFFRAAPLVGLAPGFGEQSVPMRLKAALAIGLAILLARLRPEVPSYASLHPLQVLTLLGAETVNGLLLGFALRLYVLILQTAGSIAAQATSLSQLFGGAATEPIPAMGHVLVIGGVAVAMAAGLHVAVVEYLYRSYDVLGIGTFPNSVEASNWSVAQVTAAFSLAFRLALPFLLASLLYNLTLGVINRAMPQLMVALVGAPVITAGGMLGFAVLAPHILTAWHDALRAAIIWPMSSAP